jgi:hypothetical protein
MIDSLSFYDRSHLNLLQRSSDEMRHLGRTRRNFSKDTLNCGSDSSMASHPDRIFQNNLQKHSREVRARRYSEDALL